MYKNKKFSIADNGRPGHKPKKRKFYGNRYINETDVSFASTSAEKLKDKNDLEVTIDLMQGYRIIHFLSVFNILSTLVKCKECENNVKFKVKGEQGLGFKLLIECDCDSKEIDFCPKINNKTFEINRRIIFVMRVLGVGLQGINIFCGLMNLGQGLSINAYYADLENIWISAKVLFQLIIRKAVLEEKAKNAEAGNEPLHLSVSGDGTWSKRGFMSLFGVVTL